MKKYKTVAQVRKELKKLIPDLLKEYAIEQHNGGVTLLRGYTTIISQKTDWGTGTLYKVHPKIDNVVGFKEAYNTLDDIGGGFSLRDAVIIAELAWARTLYGKQLDRVLRLYAREYFGDGSKKTES